MTDKSVSHKLSGKYFSHIAVLYIGFMVSFYVLQLFLNGCQIEKLLEVYDNQLRTALFGGLITVAAFLFSLKTFIVVNMKDNIYDKEEYQSDIRSKNEKYQKKIKIYEPLRRLSRLLYLSVWFSMVSAIMHVTIGYIDSYWFFSFTMTASFIAAFYFFASLIQIQSNLEQMFDLLDK